MSAVASKTFDVSKFQYSFQAFDAIDQLRPGEKEKTAVAVQILQKWGTCELEYIQKRLKLSASSYQSILTAPDIVENRVTKTPMSKEDLPKEALLILAKHPEAKFYSYCNKVGNYKPVILVNISGKEFVVRTLGKGKAASYLKEYERLKEKQHRPEITTMPCEDGAVICLSEFMGSDTIDYRNPKHIALLVALTPAFSEECNTIDLNEGNLVINNGTLYYIDKDLVYCTYTDKKEAALECLSDLLKEIKGYGYPEEEQLVTFIKTQAKFEESLQLASAHLGAGVSSSRDEKKQSKSSKSC